MTRLIGAAAAIVLVVGPGRADDKDVTAVLDKAVKALGGEEKLAKVKAAAWTGKGTITIMGGDNAITTRTTVQGLDHFRQEFEGEFGGSKIQGVTVLAGDKGWRRF